jgi:prepilin-type processing-associated H-X9-DG protein
MRAQLSLRRGFTSLELIIVVVLVAILIALLLPAVQIAREEARQAQCKNNLKQLGLAMHNYHDTYVTFPPGWVAANREPETGPCYGWGTMLLPFLDQAELYNRIDFKRPPSVNSLTQESLAAFKCADDPSPNINSIRGKFGASSYAGNYGDKVLPGSVEAASDATGLFFWNSKIAIPKIEDGISNTLMVGERTISSASAIWMGIRSNENASDNVSSCNDRTRLNTVIDSFSSSHKGGVNILMGDGSTRFVADKIDSKTWQALGTRAGRDEVDDF